LGILIGIGAILVFVSLGYGLQKTMLEQITTSESLLSLDVTSPRSEVIAINKEKLDDISKIQNVSEVSPLAVIPGQIKLENLTSDTLFYTCYTSYFRLGGITVKEGEVFKNETDKKIIMSVALLQSLAIDPKEALGKEAKITIYKMKTTEVGEEMEILKKEEPYQISGVVDDELTSYAFLPIGTLADLQIDNYDGIKVKASDIKAIDQVREDIVSKGLLVSTLSETVDEANKIFSAIQITLAIFGLVALLVAAIGMANTMTVTLLERTNEIGVMKAIGGADNDIGFMFLTESLIMGLFGGIGGIILGLFLSKTLNFALNLLAKSLGGQGIELFYTPVWFVVFIIIFSAIVGFLSGVMPARKAEKMNPLEALRYK
jgi:putative ABC transport system permease protein